MAFSSGSYEAVGIWTSLVRHHQWLARHLLHPSVTEWLPGGKDSPLAWPKTRGSTVSYAFYSGHGCAMSFGKESRR